MTKFQINILCSIIVIIGLVFTYFDIIIVGIISVIFSYILQLVLYRSIKNKKE